MYEYHLKDPNRDHDEWIVFCWCTVWM